MGKGNLKLQVVAAEGAELIAGATIILTDENDNIMFKLQTDETGHAPEVSLPAPDIALTEDPFATSPRFAEYTARVQASGFKTATYRGIMVFDQSTSIQVITLHPLTEGAGEESETVDIGFHALDDPVMPEPQYEFEQLPPRVPREVVIPNHISVHLGRPETPSTIVRVPFIDYVKNVASHEIFDTWPEPALTANIYCIVSLTLNRVFTEFYRKRGLNFDITNHTSIDQAYVHGGTIGSRISRVVDQIFNNYLAVVGHHEPFLALYNDGVVANFPGRLSQWGSFFDARDRGYNAWQIIEKYFIRPLVLRQTNIFEGPLESWPGSPLSLNSTGIYVRTMQRYLNRVLGRHTNIIINPVDGIFGASTRNSVVVFQQIYNLPATGVIDRATWYQIARIYAIEKALWEMHSEGIRIGIGRVPPTRLLQEGATGPLVTELQFLLDYIGMYYETIPFVAETSRFNGFTAAAAREFQRVFGLNIDGVVGPQTWAMLYNVFWGIRDNVPEPAPEPAPENPPGMPNFPGILRLGSTGEAVHMVQRAITRLSSAFPGLWILADDGIFGEDLRNAIFTFQNIFGLPITGVVDQTTWERIFREYLNLQPGGEQPGVPEFPPFPGNLQMGASGENVRLLQEAINRLAPCHPGRLWILNVDGNFGAMTRDAIFSFQSVMGMPITGVVNQATWEQLFREAAACEGATPSPEFPAFPGNLQMGSSGSNVRLLQEAINRLAPCHPGRLWILNVDGNFGAMTRDAIFSFQSVMGMLITGVVNQATWERLFREAAACEGATPSPEVPAFPGNLQQGASGSNVRLIQDAINRLAPCHPGRLWILNVDGNFGAMTRDAIFSFQSVMGMPITGIVNQATWDRLFREAAACRRSLAAANIAPPLNRPLRLGSTGENVRLLQRALNIPEDGIFSTQTRDAVQNFQSASGLVIDGVVGDDVMSKLNQTIPLLRHLPIL
ncbi:MAG: peptidoglycan-binding protein [Clostridiales bacterium]|nr:peptidoglycan-binding protein [Clostridiales bacterium]